MTRCGKCRTGAWCEEHGLHPGTEAQMEIAKQRLREREAKPITKCARCDNKLPDPVLYDTHWKPKDLCYGCSQLPTAWDRLQVDLETPDRPCQALSHASEPRHPAEVVVNRDGLQWFSCRAHVPKAVTVVAIHKWFKRYGLLETTDAFG